MTEQAAKGAIERDKVDEAEAQRRAAEAAVRHGAGRPRPGPRQRRGRRGGAPRGRDPPCPGPRGGEGHQASGGRQRPRGRGGGDDWVRAARLDRAAPIGMSRGWRSTGRRRGEAAGASVAYRSRQVERLRQLADAGAIERKLVDEQERRLDAARNAERQAEADVGVARVISTRPRRG